MKIRYFIYSKPHGYFPGGFTKDICPPLIVSAFISKNRLVMVYED